MKMHLRAFPLLVVLVPLALAGNWAGDKPSYEPRQGTTATKRVSIENELDLDDMSMEIDGQDISERAGQIEVSLKVTTELAVTDSYDAVDGRPTKLKRSFDEISSVTHFSQSSALAGDQERDIPLKSELEGATVVFSWDEDESVYDVAFAGEEGDEKLLKNLEEDLDLRGFLPTSEVSEGDSWEIPPQAVKAALAPGGDLKLRPEGASGDPMAGMNQFSQSDIIGELDGEFTAVYKGTRDEGGTRVAVIKLKIEAQSARDMTENLEEIQEMMKGSMPPGLEIEMEISALDSEYEYDAEGELLWDLETGLAHGLQLSGEVRMIVDASMTMKMGDSEKAMDMSNTYVGNQTITLTTGE